MPSTHTERLLNTIEEERTRFLATLAAGGRGWDAPAIEGEWSARDIARHVFENDYFFAGQVASLLDLATPEEPAVRFDSVGAAVDALHVAADSARSILRSVHDEDLPRPWQEGMSLADLLAFYADHTREHVDQIQSARAPLTLAS